MKTYADVKVEFDNNNIGLISLEKLVGKKVKEIQGHVSNEFSDPVFKIYRIIFSDDSFEFVEGEHDISYFPKLESVSYEELESIDQTSPNYYAAPEELEEK